VNAGTRPARSALLLGTLTLVALGLTAAAVTLTIAYWHRRYDIGNWGGAETAYFVAGWSSVLLGQLVGLFLWWRSPRNSTGRWLWLAGAVLGLWFLGIYWPNAVAMQLTWLIFLMRPALAMCLLGWPTARPTRRIRQWIFGITAAWLGTSIVFGLFDGSSLPAGWPKNPLAPFSVAWVGATLGSGAAWVFMFAPGVAAIVVLVRQRGALPVSARRLVTPVTVTGILVFGSDLLSIVIGNFGDKLTFDSSANRVTVLGALDLVQNYAQVGIAALGLLVAWVVRRHSLGSLSSGARQGEIDLGHATAIVSPSSALQHLLADPSARVLYCRPDRVWVDADGVLASPGGDHRAVTPVLDASGVVVGAIDSDARLAANPMLVEVAVATIVTRLENERAAALAHARHTELVALQHALLDAGDGARRRLERDLHDGAQQRLVGLALSAGLAARDGNGASNAAMLNEVEAARLELLDVVDGGPPAVLARGLASALSTLDVTTPIPVELHLDGDLAGADRLARSLWFIATEAVTNAVKHSGASTLRVELRVDPVSASLRVADDGAGGLDAPPTTIAERVNETGGWLEVESLPGAGTAIIVTMDRREAAVADR
jgi:signal transduction histidine kinase